MRTIEDVKIGEKLKNDRNGEGMITGKTTRTVTATFTNGNICKLTYKTKDAYFYPSDFS